MTFCFSVINIFLHSVNSVVPNFEIICMDAVSFAVVLNTELLREAGLKETAQWH